MPPKSHSSISEAQVSPTTRRSQNIEALLKGIEWHASPLLISLSVSISASSLLSSSYSSNSFLLVTVSTKQYALKGEERTSDARHRIFRKSPTSTDLFIFLELYCKIMSLHRHHHQHHQQQQQQQQPTPTTTITTTSTTTATTTTASVSVASTGVQSSTRYSTSSTTFQQHQRYHLHQHQHHYLPPRPPSTTSSGSISTGFPDDLQDDLNLPPPEPLVSSSSAAAAAVPQSSSSSFTFHPAHHHPHTLQYHRHTSPHFPPSRGGGAGGGAGVGGIIASSTSGGGGSGTTTQVHHHHHHFVPPTQIQSAQQRHHHHFIQSAQIGPHGHVYGCSGASGGGSIGGGGGGGSRAASRQTFVDDEEILEGGEQGGTGGDEENLLLEDNSVGVQDVVYLDPVTTDNFLTNIVQRFKRDFIYTYVGEGALLVSVNPYKPLSIFSPRVKAAYRNISNPFQLPPHIYGQLCLILQRNTSSLERTQTLLLTGESGSGKTTNLSYLLDFLATKYDPSSTLSRPSRSRRNSGRSTGGGSTRGGGQVQSSYYLSTGSLHRHQQHHQVHIPSCPQHVCQQQIQPQQYYYYVAGGPGSTTGGGGGGSGRASSLSLTAPSQSHVGSSSSYSSGPNMALSLLQGNFLLNAFGNCKTSKNWDASRFGKLIQLQIDFLGNVVGGRILSYQLEKWRVQGPIPNSGGPHPTHHHHQHHHHHHHSTETGTSSPHLSSSASSSAYERNFHIFYILLAGADSSTLKSLRLTRNLETYAMLNVRNHSSFLSLSQTNPSTPFCPQDHFYQRKGSRLGSSCYEGCFHLIKSTLGNILSQNPASSIQADHVFRMLAAILKLNNLIFAPVANIDGTEGCDVTNEQDLVDIGHLLNILPSSVGPTSTLYSPTTPTNPNNNSNNNNGSNNHNHQHPLKTILTTRRVTRSDGTVAQIELTSSESSSLRNSLTVSLYNRLFSWLTKQISFSPTAQFHPISSQSGGSHSQGQGQTGCKSFSSTSTTTTPGTAPPHQHHHISISSHGVGGATSSSSAITSQKYNLLNIVDFYGFEVFQTNSIEQFLINFTNEKIQYVLADLRLRMLQEEFVKDGLEWITIDTAGSSPSSSTNSSTNPPGKLIDLVEENCHGLLSIFANCGNDHDLERQFARRFSSPKGGGGNSSTSPAGDPSDSIRDPTSHPNPSTTPTKSNASLVEYLQQSFRLRHWAGPVVYSTRQFATKNRDTLPPHLPHQLYSWTGDPLLRSLFSHDGRNPPPPVSSHDSSPTSSRLLATSNMELSLRNLFQKCSSSSKNHRIYYIRCLKPNELSQPAAELCELALLKHQVKYHRLIDFVRVYRDGFTYNLGAFEFLERYKLLSLNTWPNWRLEHDIRLGIQVLMKDLQMKEGVDWCFGGGGVTVGGGGAGGGGSGGMSSTSQTGTSPIGGIGVENLKVYLKGQRILSELEDFRRERLDDLALLIQKIWRGYRDWREYRRMKKAHKIICKAWTSYLNCKEKEQRKMWKQMKAAVRLIQQRYILWKRSLFLKQLIMQVRAELQKVGVGGGVGGGLGMSGGMILGGLCPSLAGGPVVLPQPGSMLSPISRDWPYSPSYLEEASFQLRRVFHRWRCRLYRSWFNETERAKMAEKVTASLLFKDKKSSYSRSVSHPYLGDYIRLRQNSQWRRTMMMMMLQTASQLQQEPLPSSASGILEESSTSMANPGGDVSGEVIPGKKQMLPSQQSQIVFADLINKITRSSGKFLPIVLVVTTTHIMILDPRTLNIKYKIPASEIWRLSVSPYGDDICVLHLQQPMRFGGGSGSVLGPGEQSGLFGQGILSDDDDAYYQFGEEPSPTGNSSGGGGIGGGCVCSSSRDSGPPPAFPVVEQPSPSPQQLQCQPGSGGCGLFGGGGGGGADSDSGHYAISDVVKLTKGDLILHTCHLIEMVTKIYLVVKNAMGKPPELIISNEFPAVFNNQRVQLSFRYSKAKSSRNPPPLPTLGQEQIMTELPTEEITNRAQMTRSPPTVLQDGPMIQLQQSSSMGGPTISTNLPLIPPPPPATSATIGIAGKDEPVIPPSQIKITRKKSTRMEFLIGHSS